MSILQERKQITEKMQMLIDQQKAQLNELKIQQNQQFAQNLDQNVEIQLLGPQDYYQNSQILTQSLVDTYLDYLNQFQEQFESTKEILLLMPQDKKQLQESLVKVQEAKSRLSISAVNSFLINHNSEIERAKVNNLRDKLSLFIQNYQQTNQMTCLKHNQQIEFVDISKDQNIQERRLCKDCSKKGIRLQEFFEKYLMQFFQFKIQSEEKRSDIQQKIRTPISILQAQSNTDRLYNDFNQQFKSRIQVIDEINGSHIIDTQDFNKMARDFAQTEDNFIQYRSQFDMKLKESIKKDFAQAQTQMTSILDNFGGNNSKTPTLILNKNENNYSSVVQNINFCKLFQLQQIELCQVLCFNRNNKLIATAKKNVIIIWRFQRDKLQYITELQKHKNDVSSLVFELDSDTLISGGGDGDGQIVIWVQKSENEWIEAQTIQLYGGIKVIILNHLQNQLIVGSQKGMITILEFKQKQLKKIQEKQLNEKENKPIFGLTFNHKTQQIITCGQDKCIRLFQIREKLECTILKQCDSSGMRIQFIDDSSFVYVQRNGWLFYCKIEWGAFKEIQKIKLSSEDHDYIYSPIRYNQERKILIIKHFKKIYCLKKQNDEQFQLFDELEYQSDPLFTAISNDWQYLATWIDKGKEQSNLENQTQMYSFYELDFQ